MSKRTKDDIPLGSGMLYLALFEDKMPTIETLFVDDNRAGYIKGGAALSYTEETTIEQDDLGYVHKIITTKEEAKLKAGLLTWNGETLQTIIDRCKTTVEDGKRITKIGGHGNAQGKYYAIGFHQEDKQDGDIWVMMKGRNTAGVNIAYAMENGSVIEPEFTALPHDSDGTLIEYIEEVGTETQTASTEGEES